MVDVIHAVLYDNDQHIEQIMAESPEAPVRKIVVHEPADENRLSFKIDVDSETFRVIVVPCSAN